MSKPKKQAVPDVLMVMKPVDGGRAVIGLIECPHCGQDHFTTQIRCGELHVFCQPGLCGDPVRGANDTQVL